MYARYLSAHAECRTQLRILSLASDLSDEERSRRAFTAYAACYAARYELAVLAPQPVLTPAKEFDRHARDLRDLVIEGTTTPNQNHPQGDGRMQPYLGAMDRVHAAMRADLGADEYS